MTLPLAAQTTQTAALLGVRVHADDPDRAARHFGVILGVPGQRTPEGLALCFDQTRILLTDGTLPAVATPQGKPRQGIWGIDLAVADPGRTLDALAAQGHAVSRTTQGGHVDQNGVRIFLSALGSSPAPATKADVRLDHVALLVGGFEAPTRFWETLTGVHSHRIDVHPVSNGTFGAVRLLLGDCMVELVVPVPGTESVLATRLGTLGEGPATLALPAQDLGTKLAQLARAGIATVERPPHWFVRPPDAAGVLLQLTPRVNH